MSDSSPGRGDEAHPLLQVRHGHPVPLVRTAGRADQGARRGVLGGDVIDQSREMGDARRFAMTHRCCFEHWDQVYRDVPAGSSLDALVALICDGEDDTHYSTDLGAALHLALDCGVSIRLSTDDGSIEADVECTTDGEYYAATEAHDVSVADHACATVAQCRATVVCHALLGLYSPDPAPPCTREGAQ
jgi:hypothetical protein